MKAAPVSEIKKELSTKTHKELLSLCLRLARFKKENKELLTYLLYEADDQDAYIRAVKIEIDMYFESINRSRIFFIKKTLRKTLRATNKFIRYTLNKQVEVELLLYFCTKFKEAKFPVTRSTALRNLYEGQLRKIKKSISSLHEDLQYDYTQELKELV